MREKIKNLKYNSITLGTIILTILFNIISLASMELLNLENKYILTIIVCAINCIIIVFSAFLIRTNADRDNTKIEELAYKDFETDIYNSNYLNDNFNLIAKKPTDYAYITLDIDNFKYINSIMGYDNGTEILCIISSVLKKAVDNNELAIRVSGDIFGILMNENEQKKIVSRMEGIFKEIRIFIGERYSERVNIVFSSGVYIIEKDDETIKKIIDKANAARKSAKNIYNKNIEFYNRNMEESIKNRTEIEEDMERALRDEEFIVYLQPKVNMITGKLYGAEALARWDHKTKGLLTPGSFIPVFEENGFIVKLDYYIFEQVCKLKRRWMDEGKKYPIVSVNMSRMHIYDKNYIYKLVSIAEKYNVPRNELEIEVTENAFFEDAQMLLSFTEELKRAGFLISIDDFGSGFSSLNMLKDVKADVLKIDRNFLISTNKNDGRGKKILKNVIAMARDLKIDIVTEGVEEISQIELLTNYGCEIAQGFYYARPMSVEEYEKFAIIHGATIENSCLYKFDGNFKDENGGVDAKPIGSGFTFEEGTIKGTQSIRLPGGPISTNYIELPEKFLKNESYTISLWVMTEDSFSSWSSLIYAEYDTGFMSFMPVAWNGSMSFRILDNTYTDGWHDNHYMAIIKKNQWYHIALTYNSKLEVSRLYVNGEAVGYRGKVPPIRDARLLWLGGDIYQESMACKISNLMVSDNVKSSSEIWEMYQDIKSKM